MTLRISLKFWLLKLIYKLFVDNNFVSSPTCLVPDNEKSALYIIYYYFVYFGNLYPKQISLIYSFVC